MFTTKVAVTFLTDVQKINHSTTKKYIYRYRNSFEKLDQKKIYD